VGKICQQTVIDGHSSHAFAKLYLSKVPMTAVHVLHDRVLPFYEEHNIEIQHLLTDKVREYGAWRAGHPFELSLVVPSHSANRASPHRHRLAEDQRPLRAFSLRGERELSQRGISLDVLRIAGTVVAAHG
jgi:hypothetical protein